MDLLQVNQQLKSQIIDMRSLHESYLESQKPILPSPSQEKPHSHRSNFNLQDYQRQKATNSDLANKRYNESISTVGENQSI